MCVKYKSAFTLAETIMTLAIVGVVIVAAIPTMTTKLLSDNTKLKAYCSDENHSTEARCAKLSNNLFSECGSTKSSICTSYPIVIGNSTPETFEQSPGVVSTFSLTYTPSASPINFYDYFVSGNRMIRIGDFFLRERGDNFFLTSDVNANGAPTFPNGTRNTIIGAIGTNTTATFENNTIIGSGVNKNNLSSCTGNIQNNVIYGINNTLCNNNTVSDSIIYGGSNTVTHSNSLVYGAFNKTKAANSVLIGTYINENDADNNDFSIGNVITSAPPAAGATRTINFSAPTTISGSFTGIFLHNSDIRLKNLKGKYTKGLKEVLQIKPVEFVYNNDNTGTIQIGVIAQDIQPIFPEAVVKMPNGYLGVDSDPIFFAMLNALKELNEQKLAEEKRHEKLLQELEEVEKELKVSNIKAKNTLFYDIWTWLTNLFSKIGGLLNA